MILQQRPPRISDSNLMEECRRFRTLLSQMLFSEGSRYVAASGIPEDSLLNVKRLAGPNPLLAYKQYVIGCALKSAAVTAENELLPGAIDQTQ